MQTKEPLSKRQTEFIEKNLKTFPNAAEDVLIFIANFKCGEGRKEENVIEDLFTTGYCYYFANILKDAFGGECVWLPDQSHIVWKDTRKEDLKSQLLYDIKGVYKDGSRPYPIGELRDDLESFRHRGHDFDICRDINLFKEKSGWEDSQISEAVFDLIPLDERMYPFPNETDTYRYWSTFKETNVYKETMLCI